MQSVGAVILAAGGSSRFGSAKQLAQFRGKSFVRQTADIAQQAGCSPVVLVTGSNAAKVSNQVTTPAVENKNWREGIGSSIRLGVEYLMGLKPDVSAIVFLVCDQPLLHADVISKLVALHRESGKEIVASRYADTLGVPALFGHTVFRELLSLSGENGAKKIILENCNRVTEVPFPQGNLDIDTPADYRHLKTSEPARFNTFLSFKAFRWPKRKI
jgi:molybdenum cofactor cytidylyltransferase